MEPSRLSLTLLLVLVAVIALTPQSSVVARSSPADHYPTYVFAQEDTHADYLAGHNAARKAVGVGPMTWSEELAVYARNYAAKRARDCQLIHSGGPYGENIAWGSFDLPPVQAVALWVNEKPFYNYASNSCSQGEQCLHYTQVVWRKSLQLGCAKVRCATGGTFITCNYNPPGNYIGQRPY